MSYVVLVLLVGVQRLGELVISKRNMAWARARGGRETGFGHYPVMVLLHTGLLVACVVEAAHRPFLPWLGWPMLAVLVVCQGVRVWCIRALGRQWNTRVIAVPGMPVVTSGPYRYLRHPNYVAVVAEGIALPLVHSAWLTATVFTLANAALLRVRIGAENRVLSGA